MLPSAHLSVPPTTRALVTSLIVFSLLSLVISDQYLVISPGTSVYYPWTFISATWVENLVGFVVGGVGLLFMGRYFEQAWGSRELIKFLTVVAIVSNTVTFFVLLVMYFVKTDVDWLFTARANGLAAILTGFVVAFKQAVPEHKVQLFGRVSIRAKNLPPLVLLVYSISNLIGLVPFAQVVLAHIGFFVAWYYLRFWKLGDGGIQGDRSESFAFVTFFPEFVGPYLKPVSHGIYAVGRRLRLVPALSPTLPTTIYDANEALGRNMPVDAEAERRRAVALKALNSHLAESQVADGPEPR
ncbi:hypothetical protein HDU85_007302 [Gaertneriomyces sp. JEL0708]|nr:hypothetical protein HDU85_007302 [Gaertneriomyces sp. JEL0708]